MSLVVLRAKPKQFELLDMRCLNDSESWAHLAVAGNDLFVSGLNALAAYRWTAPGTPGSKPAAGPPPASTPR